jgi:hypothetical protein
MREMRPVDRRFATEMLRLLGPEAPEILRATLPPEFRSSAPAPSSHQTPPMPATPSRGLRLAAACRLCGFIRALLFAVAVLLALPILALRAAARAESRWSRRHCASG